jgi:hypothetical protein
MQNSSQPPPGCGDSEVDNIHAGQIGATPKNSITPPVAMTGSTPKRLMRWPVKNDGRNIPMMCICMTVVTVDERPAAGVHG